MPTVTFFTGLEGFPDSPVTSGGGLGINTPTGNVTISTVQAHTGLRSMRINPSASIAWAGHTLDGTETLIVIRLYIRFASFPTSDQILFFGHVNSGSAPRIDFSQANSRVDASVGGSGSQQGMTVSLDTWYRIECRMVCNDGAGNRTIDWGMAAGDESLTNYTQVSVAEAATTFLAVRFGSTSSETADFYIDDIMFSETSGDYPLGAGGTERLYPASDGTHSAGTNTMEDNAGNDINGTTVTAYTLVDEVPPSSADYVRQAANSTTSYVEVNFSDMTASYDSIIAARGLLGYMSAGTAGNQGATIMSHDSFSSFTEIFGNPTTRTDYSESSIFYRSAIISGATTTATVNALQCRMGYSNDTNPNPWWVAVWVEVAYVPSTGAATKAPPVFQKHTHFVWRRR